MTHGGRRQTMDKDPFQDYEPTISRVGKVVDWLVDHLPQFIPDLGITHGDHFNTGGAVLLDEALEFEQIESD